MLTSLSYVRETVGVGCVAALLYLLLPEIILLLLYRACLSLGESAAGALTGGASVLATLRTSVDLLLGTALLHTVLSVLAVGLSLAVRVPS